MTLFSSISDPFGGTVTGIVKHSPIQQEYHVTGYSVELFKQDPSICTISGHFSEYRTAYAERECPFLGNWFISNTEEYWRVVSVSFLPSEARLPWGCCLITNLQMTALTSGALGSIPEKYIGTPLGFYLWENQDRRN